MAEKLGLKPEFIATDWRTGADPAAIEAKLRKEDKKHEIKAVCVLHNETSTGCLSPIAEIRKAIDARRPSGAVHGRHHLVARLDRLPPRRMGRRRHRRRLAEGPDAAARHVVQRASATRRWRRRRTSKLPKSFWAWDEMIAMNKSGFFPYTPATQMLYGLAEGDRHAARGRARQRVRAPRPPRRGDAPRGARLGPRDPVHGAEVLFADLTGDADAGRPQRRRVPQARARALQHLATARASDASPAR